MDVPPGGDGVRELEERRSAGQDREAEQDEPGWQVELQLAGPDAVDQPGETLRRSRVVEPCSDQPPQMRLPAIVVTEWPAGAVEVGAGEVGAVGP